MKEIVRVKLENEMDLILAHKRAMKLCELTGFSLMVQTSLATAVSEIARCAIEHGQNAVLILGIDVLTGGRKILKIVVQDPSDFSGRATEAIFYAKRLVDEIETIKSSKETKIILKQQLNFGGTITDTKVDTFVKYFQNEPPLSPYDELRRKNLLLQDLADKLKESESDYQVLTDTLPIMMFSVNNRGVISYTNRWLQDYLGATPKELTNVSWQNFVHTSDYSQFSKDLSNAIQRQVALKGQYRFREKSTGEFLWHILSVIPLKNEKDIVTRWIGFIADINAQKLVEQTLKDNRGLKEAQEQLFINQRELQQKIIELNRSNYELEQFAHLASHDLQEPLRKLFFYSDVLRKRYATIIDDAGVTMINNMNLAASRMKELISDLLSYSQLQQQKLEFEPVDLNAVMEEIMRDLDFIIRDKNAKIEVDALPIITGNKLRLRQLFTNLISNALKYSKKDVHPIIKVSIVLPEPDRVLINVRDNGIGFEDQYRERIFGLFERLHTRDQFPGTGIGLSICKRIAELHHGTIAASSIVNEYALFEVTLPVNQNLNLALND
ncbi:ATP-binding protein [Pseudochryseolinea flava]|uniref:histidine kinase n=1 Tax=Pseudochryseolinea flava TaxID=2059302 RepID=A0A364XXI4_9BACT|nr:ATP-binding protein [Pseudochryseolinea flava]RAV98708.1 PAS domain-containing sensor histidine kinase [Pseudochryseolinea flava]